MSVSGVLDHVRDVGRLLEEVGPLERRLLRDVPLEERLHGALAQRVALQVQARRGTWASVSSQRCIGPRCALLWVACNGMERGIITCTLSSVWTPFWATSVSSVSLMPSKRSTSCRARGEIAGEIRLDAVEA